MPPQTAKRTILIVDDEVTNLKLIVEYLKAYSFEVITARNGESGLERADFSEPNLILLDVMMPGINGFETCRRLKANPQTTHIPVIFMTALSDSVDKVKGLELGAVDYVTKPIEMAEVLARVNTHLALQAMQEQLHRQNQQLEARVQERTATLETEMLRRQQQIEEKSRLFDLLTEQSEQLRTMTNALIEQQTEDRQGMLGLNEQFQQQLTQIKDNLQGIKTDLSPAAESSHQRLASTLQILDNLTDSLKQATNRLSTPETALLNDHILLKLSAREREVLGLLVTGKSNSEIASVLVLALSTVQTYVKRIRRKLDIYDTPGLVMFAQEHGLI